MEKMQKKITDYLEKPSEHRYMCERCGKKPARIKWCKECADFLAYKRIMKRSEEEKVEKDSQVNG